MHAKYRFLFVLPLVAFAFAAAHLAFEHFTGGVQSHNLLSRPDLPAISNWLGLITLPLSGVALGLRLSRQPRAVGWAGVPPAILVGLSGAVLYGAALATSFALDASSITSAAFLGLFPCAVLLPVYRAEYILGFVVGMTVTFGAVLPFAVALALAALSFGIRFLIRSVLAVCLKRRAPDRVL